MEKQTEKRGVLNPELSFGALNVGLNGTEA